jgi:transcription elongation factor GreA
MTTESYLTAEGEDRLRKELEELKGTARDDLAKRLRAAVQQGDLSENADYINAKEEQGFLEGRIQELEQILSNVIIIDELEQNLNEVGIGDRVTIQEDGEPEESYRLVGSKEANPENGSISHESPIGHALIGRRVGDKVTVDTPTGQFSFKILKIE